MSTLAVIATSTLTGVIGAAAMYVPARLALRDARTYRDEADRTFGAAESLADEVERTRNLPWHYAAIEAGELEEKPEPWIADESLWAAAALRPVDGDVLHVQPHQTGEHPVVESEHKPNCPDLYYCPTVDEVESGCHGGFDVCCAAPELHQPIPDERDDEDIAGEEQPGEGWFDGLVAVIKRIGRGIFVAVVVPPIFVWNWCVRIPFERISDAIADARQQRADRDRIGSSADDVEERRVEIEAWVQANPPTQPGYKPWHLNDVTALHEVIRPGRHRAAEIPAQRNGDADE